MSYLVDGNCTVLRKSLNDNLYISTVDNMSYNNYGILLIIFNALALKLLANLRATLKLKYTAPIP